jgi:flavin reductase (DIM6/NTAB) family NADH-FMN oxidoreductase RutF
MAKIQWKPGNMIYPLPAVMVSCADKAGKSNIITVAWTGTVCTNPPMAYISVRPERHSYHMIRETGEFVINLTTKDLAFATDYCGVRSGRDVDKFAEMKLTKETASVVAAPMIGECPVNIECKVTEVKELGSHHMFLADILAVNVEKRMLEGDKLCINRAHLCAFAHGEYYKLGERIGKFGFSVKKKKMPTKSAKK